MLHSIQHRNLNICSVIDSSKVAKKVISDLLAPAQAIVSLLDAVADAHPAVKVCYLLVSFSGTF